MSEAASPEWSSLDLIARVEAGEPIQVLDVRAPRRLADGSIDMVAPDRFFNHKGSEIVGLADPREVGLSDDAPVVVVCGLGNDSRRIAHLLNEHGFSAVSLQGGMTEWMRTIVCRSMSTPASLDRVLQFDRVGKGGLAYALISSGEAFVVDAPRQTGSIEQKIMNAGARIVGVADTHAHADYISGAASLSKRLDVPYYLHPADAILPFDGRPGVIDTKSLADGATISFGRASLTVQHMPGHTEGSVCLRLDEDLVLSGDLVFVRSVGRPDLGGKLTEWTHALWTSLARARREWSPGMDVLPAHYANESERNSDFTVGCEFGVVCRNNEPLMMDDETKFAAWVRARTAPFPDAYRKIKAINLGLLTVDADEADELEAGKNQCALG